MITYNSSLAVTQQTEAIIYEPATLGPIVGGVVGGVAVLLIIFFVILAVCCRSCRRRKQREEEEIPLQELEKKKEKREREEREERDKQRKMQEKEEAGFVVEIVKRMGERKSEEYLINFRRLPDLGSRLQKYWFSGHCRDGSEVLVAVAPLSKKCPLRLDGPTLEVINNVLFPSIRKHQFIQPLYEVIHDTRTLQVLTVQPLISRGSLRDLIYQTSPRNDWSQKYTSSVGGLPADKIALYGKQILQAILFLYKLGFPSLGHIQTGNVFIVSNEWCKLGGYENTLLGYRTRLYRTCEQNGCIDTIDTIMFGHLLYEMASGTELPAGTLEPEHQHYEGIEDNLRDIIKFVFSRKFERDLKPIMKDKFFSDIPSSGESVQIEGTKEVKRLLSDLSRTGPARQPKPAEETSPTVTASKEEAQRYIEYFLEHSKPLQLVSHLPDIGRRQRKYWSKIRDKEQNQIRILSIAKVPDNCSIALSSSNLETMNRFFSEIKHPHLYKKIEFHYDQESHQILAIQPHAEKGSLRDRLWGIKDPLADWSKKRHSTSNPLGINKIALYGRQILEAIGFLYEQGFPPLGHIHVGNIFVGVGEGGKDICLLGGYENTLLGFQPSHRVFAYKEYSSAIDLMMFGHVIFEMSTGRELQNELPQEGEYELLTGDKKSIVELLKFIFEVGHGVHHDAMPHQSALQKVIDHDFFGNVVYEAFDSEHQEELEDPMKQLLVKVTKRKRKGHQLTRALGRVKVPSSVKKLYSEMKSVL